MDTSGILRKRRADELERHAEVLRDLKVLDSEEATKVLQANPEYVIAVIDAQTCTVKVPAFQFLREGLDFKRDSSGVPMLNPAIEAIFKQQHPGTFKPCDLNAWSILGWWFKPMHLDYSLRAVQPAFRPIDVVNDAEVLRALVKWWQDWKDEPGYG